MVNENNKTAQCSLIGGSCNMGLGEVISSTIYEFGTQTSIAGLNNAFQRKSYFKKVYWSVIFVAFLVGTIHSVLSNLSAYYRRHIITSNDLDASSSLIFPAISLCNHNRVHCTNLFEEEIRHKIMLENSKNETIKSQCLKIIF